MSECANRLSASAFTRALELTARRTTAGGARERLAGWTGRRLLPCLLLACSALTAGALETSLAQEYVPDRIIVELIPGAAIEDVNQRWGTTTLDSFEDGLVHLLSAEGLGGDMITLAEQMTGDPDVSVAEPNFREDTPEGIGYMLVVAIGGDQVDYEDQEFTQRIGLSQAHEVSRGLGAKIAVLDTGIDPDHPLFEGRLAAGGYDFVDEDADPSEEADGIDQDDDGIADEGFAHGTMVAGLVLLVAPDATILPLRVLDDEGRSDDYTVARALRYAREQGATVFNLSFGSPGGSSILQTEMGYAEDSGVVLVSGAGNENRGDPAYYPGDSSKVIMVTALDSVDVKAPFADWNDDVLVSAPGDGIRSAYPGGDWGLASGCSYAVPLVSGMAALIQSVRPDWSSERVQAHIEQSVDPIYHLPGNQPYIDELGSGRIDVGEALDGLGSASVPPGETGGASIHAAPNPAHGVIWFLRADQVGRAAGSEILISDVTGRRIRSLAVDASGATRWDGRDDRGAIVPAGVYLYRASGDAHSSRLVLVR